MSISSTSSVTSSSETFQQSNADQEKAAKENVQKLSDKINSLCGDYKAGKVSQINATTQFSYMIAMAPLIIMGVYESQKGGLAKELNNNDAIGKNITQLSDEFNSLSTSTADPNTWAAPQAIQNGNETLPQGAQFDWSNINAQGEVSYTAPNGQTGYFNPFTADGRLVSGIPYFDLTKVTTSNPIDAVHITGTQLGFSSQTTGTPPQFESNLAPKAYNYGPTVKLSSVYRDTPLSTLAQKFFNARINGTYDFIADVTKVQDLLKSNKDSPPFSTDPSLYNSYETTLNSLRQIPGDDLPSVMEASTQQFTGDLGADLNKNDAYGNALHSVQQGFTNLNALVIDLSKGATAKMEVVSQLEDAIVKLENLILQSNDQINSQAQRNSSS